MYLERISELANVKQSAHAHWAWPSSSFTLCYNINAPINLRNRIKKPGQGFSSPTGKKGCLEMLSERVTRIKMV